MMWAVCAVVPRDRRVSDEGFRGLNEEEWVDRNQNMCLGTGVWDECGD